MIKLFKATQYNTAYLLIPKNKVTAWIVCHIPRYFFIIQGARVGSSTKFYSIRLQTKDFKEYERKAAKWRKENQI